MTLRATTARKPSAGVPESHAIEYLSSPANVRMGNDWFDVASLGHFWVQRRFEIMRDLAGDSVSRAAEMAEVGCGHGLLQRQIEDHYGQPVIGFDLNEHALTLNLSRKSRVCCYDIHQHAPEFLHRFDLIFLFDVLEHITEETRFLHSVVDHLAPQGKLLVNVPAGQWAYSDYDRAAGHVCRYSIDKLRQVSASAGLSVIRWTYWGLPLVPLLALRKVLLALQRNGATTISTGFDSRSGFLNSLFRLVSRCEILPQHALGTSLMAIVERRDPAS